MALRHPLFERLRKVADDCVVIIREKGVSVEKIGIEHVPDCLNGEYSNGIALQFGELKHAITIRSDALMDEDISKQAAEKFLEWLNSPNGVKRAEVA